MSRLVSFLLLSAIVAVAGVLFFRVMAGFLLPVFLALVMTVIFRPLHHWLTGRLDGRARVAAVLTTATALVAVLVPTLSILILAGAEAVSVLSSLDEAQVRAKFDSLRDDFGLSMSPDELHFYRLQREINALLPVVFGDDDARSGAITTVRNRFAQIDEQTLEAEKRDAFEHAQQALDDFDAAAEPAERRLALDALRTAYATLKPQPMGNRLFYWLKIQANPDGEQLAALRGQLQDWARPMALSTTQFVGSFLAGLVIGLGVMILSFYYFLADGPTMVSTVMRLSPLEDRYERQMIEQFDNISRAVVIATLLSAVVQGLLASVGYALAGLEAIVLLTVLTTLLAMIPFVGAAAVWGSCSFWLLFIEERAMAAVLLAIYGTLVVSMADNVIKPLVLRGRANLHPMLALLSVIGGVQALGPIGIFVGPMAVAFLQALLSMLNVELESLAAESADSASESK